MADTPKYYKLGTNIRYSQVGSKLLLKIDLEAKPKPSQSGRAMIFAETKNFETLSEIDGEFGLKLMFTQRKQFKEKKKEVKSAKPKRRAKRDDDED